MPHAHESLSPHEVLSQIVPANMRDRPSTHDHAVRAALGNGHRERRYAGELGLLALRVDPDDSDEEEFLENLFLGAC